MLYVWIGILSTESAPTFGHLCGVSLFLFLLLVGIVLLLKIFISFQFDWSNQWSYGDLTYGSTRVYSPESLSSEFRHPLAIVCCGDTLVLHIAYLWWSIRLISLLPQNCKYAGSPSLSILYYDPRNKPTIFQYISVLVFGDYFKYLFCWIDNCWQSSVEQSYHGHILQCSLLSMAVPFLNFFIMNCSLPGYTLLW